MPGPVALTGATGFIGRPLAEQLLAEGCPVRALTRHPQTDRPGLTWIQGELDNARALRQLVAGSAAVIHCAGAVRGASEKHFRHVNLDGTKAVADATVHSAPSARFLLISSLAARQPALSWYAASKRAAERFMEEESSLPWTIFRPPAVYGPGDRELLPLFRAMHRGWLPVSAPPGARFSLLHVSDLVLAVRAWLATDLSRRMFEPDDGTPGGYDWDTIRRLAQEAWRHPIRRVPVPPGILRGAAWMNLLLSRLTGHAPMLTPGKVRELLHSNWVCDNAPILRELGWKPTIRFTDALALPMLIGFRTGT